MYMSLCYKLDDLYFAAKNGLYKLCREEDGEVNVIATVLLIGVAVALIIIFKSKITTLLNNLMKTVSDKAKNVLN